MLAVRTLKHTRGQLPIIITQSHDGPESPGWPKRRKGSGIVRNDRAHDMGELLAASLREKTGFDAHLIKNMVKRSFVDMNRAVQEGTPANSPQAKAAHRAYYSAVKSSRTAVEKECGFGLLLDLHGQQKTNTVQLGYAVSLDSIQKGSAWLSSAKAGWVRRGSSIYSLSRLARNQGVKFSDLLAGDRSLGGLLEKRRVSATPSRANAPGSGVKYFTGAYTVRGYGSSDSNGGTVDAVQVEIPEYWRDPKRETGSGRRRQFVDRLAEAVLDFMYKNYGIYLRAASGKAGRRGACDRGRAGAGKAGRVWVVRKASDVSSTGYVSGATKQSMRLKAGARIAEVDCMGNRLKFRRKSGGGPRTGWVSIRKAGQQQVKLA